jgi:exopolysaccharide production protein ExoY
MLDASVALICVALFSPLFLMVALLIRMSSPGPVFYGHTRVGHGGRAFRCWKFRTMVVDGEAVLERHLAGVPGARAEWEANRKLRNDPRVTRIGQVLRDYSVDELPQLFNVLFGDMSIVGPRPVVQDELDRYGPAATAYLAARPGITGLWQTSGRSDTSYERRVELDARYVTEWSFWLDCLILLRTVPVVLGARGAC